MHWHSLPAARGCAVGRSRHRTAAHPPLRPPTLAYSPICPPQSSRSAEPPLHDHHGPAPMERDEGTSPTLRSTTSTYSSYWAASTVGSPSSPRSSRATTNLFGRLGTPGAPRWADEAVGELRWSERITTCAGLRNHGFCHDCDMICEIHKFSLKSHL